MTDDYKDEIVERATRQGVTYAMTTEFDVKTFALNKAIECRHDSDSDKRIVERAEVFEAFLRNVGKKA